MSGAAAAGAAAAAAVMNAIKASGVLVRLEPADFLRIIGKQPDSLIVQAPGGLFSPKYWYLVSYRGLAFFTKSHEELRFPPTVEIIRSRSIYIPG
jgi:hypothetical protein